MNRTITIDFMSFTLPSPRSATFSFNSTIESSNTIRIVVPTSSNWHMPLHWHPHSSSSSSSSTTSPCKRITSVDGHLNVYTVRGVEGSCNTFGGSGLEIEFMSDERVSWRRDSHYKELLTVDLIADQNLWRNICSAVLDKDIFPQLASTPYWFRGLYATLALFPRCRVKLLDSILRIQLQSIFFAHDFHMNHGTIPLHLYWLLTSFEEPPEWAQKLELKIQLIIAKVVMATAYWIGLLFLGIKGEYPEYTPYEIVSKEYH